jgi:long-chain acyl-CoA synthetase
MFYFSPQKNERMTKEEIKRLFDFIYYQQAHYPQKQVFGYRKGDQDCWWSTDELIRDAEHLAAGLLQKGLSPGDRVIIVDYINRPEWVIADLACQLAGLVSVPVYPTISSREYAYIFQDAGVKAAFIGGQDLYEKITDAAREVPDLKLLISFDQRSEIPYWRDIPFLGHNCRKADCPCHETRRTCHHYLYFGHYGLSKRGDGQP